MADAARIGIEDVREAATRIVGEVVQTPLIESGAIWLKCESAQAGGAFKLRGATNRLLAMSDEERARGVVAFSSGNHAQGVAIAAKRLGMRATIVMPADAPALKVEGTQAQGADVIFYDRRTESREAIAARIAEDRGSIVVPSFDDPYIVAGQGTVGLEIEAQLGRAADRVVIPCGGGGLAAGIALALPETEIVIVEPEGWDDMGRSLALGRIVPVEADAPETLCDALMTPRVSEITFGILKARGATALAVSNAEVETAIRYAWEKHSLLIEPGGAAALAALLAGKVAPKGVTVAVLSGGNIDPALHARIVS